MGESRPQQVHGELVLFPLAAIPGLLDAPHSPCQIFERALEFGAEHPAINAATAAAEPADVLDHSDAVELCANPLEDPLRDPVRSSAPVQVRNHAATAPLQNKEDHSSSVLVARIAGEQQLGQVIQALDLHQAAERGVDFRGHRHPLSWVSSLFFNCETTIVIPLRLVERCEQDIQMIGQWMKMLSIGEIGLLSPRSMGC
ncbi:MAG: hypothetical protein V2A73_16280 [Pseudomonadota bacterium]